MVDRVKRTGETSGDRLGDETKSRTERNVFLNKPIKGEPEMDTSHNTKTADNDGVMPLADIRAWLYEHKDTVAFEPEYNKFGERVGTWCYDTERPEIREFMCK